MAWPRSPHATAASFVVGRIAELELAEPVDRSAPVDRPWVKVVFTSDSTPPGAGDAFVAKPFEVDELVARLAPLASMARRARPSRPGPCAAALASDMDTTKKR